MAASIELYDQSGNLIFDSSKPRILRYVGMKKLTWSFDYSQPNGQGRVYYYKAAIQDFPVWNFSNLLIMPIAKEDVEVGDGFIRYSFFTQASSVDHQARINMLQSDVPTVTLYRF